MSVIKITQQEFNINHFSLCLFLGRGGGKVLTHKLKKPKQTRKEVKFKNGQISTKLCKWEDFEFFFFLFFLLYIPNAS